MNGWIIERLNALLDNSILIIGLIIFCGKKFINEYIETLFNKKFNNELEKYKDTLNRNKMAYEIMTKKEFEFYETYQKLLSDLIVMSSNLASTVFIENSKESFNLCTMILDKVLICDGLIVAYHSYIPETLYNNITDQNNYISTEVRKIRLDITFEEAKSVSLNLSEYVGNINKFIRTHMIEISHE